MYYDIKLDISYVYQSPAAASRTLLRMMPRNLPTQHLVFGSVQTDPLPSYRLDSLDFFGNPTTELAHDDRLDKIHFRFEGRVQRTEKSGGLDLSCSLAQLASDLASVRSIAPDAPHHFTGRSPRIPHDPDIAQFAAQLVNPRMSALGAVRAISHAIHREFDFDPDATQVTTTPIEAFVARRGVCQDLSHVMISALRSVGIPAAYVSGFLRTVPPEGKTRLEGADAMHAWVRAWCGIETGWIEIDPTNDIDVALDHVTVAFGRDYSDVSPVKGSLRSAGDHDTTHAVDVIPL